MTSALRLPVLTFCLALLAHVVECRDSSIIRSHEVKSAAGKRGTDTAAVSVDSQGGLAQSEEELDEAEDIEHMDGELNEDDELEAGDEENEHETGEAGEELEGRGAEEIRYLPEKNLLALEELGKKMTAGEDVPKKSIVSLLDDESFQRLDPSTKMIPIRVGFDGDAAELSQTGHEGELSELEALVDSVGAAVLVRKILDGRSNVTSDDAKPMLLSELMDAEHELHQGSSFAEKDQEGEQDEDDGVRYLPKSQLDQLEKMYKEGQEISKDDIMMLISDDDFAALPETAIMVPVQLEGQAAQVQSAAELGFLLDTIGIRQFFESLMKGKDIHGPPSMTLAELKEDFEQGGKDKAGASLLEEGEEDEDHEEGEVAGEEEGQEGDEEDHDGEEHAGDEEEGHDEEDAAAGDDEHEDGEESFEEKESDGKPADSSMQDDGEASSDSTSSSDEGGDSSSAYDGTEAETKATM